MSLPQLGVLQVVSSEIVGGAELSYLAAVSEMDRGAIQPYAAVIPGSRRDWFFDQLRKRRIPFAELKPGAWRKRNPLPYLASVASLARVIREWNVDIVHVNHPLNRLDVAYWACRLTGTPLVAHFRMMSGDSEGEVWFRQRFGRYISRADALIHVSNAARRSLERRGVTNPNTAVIYEGVDTRRFTPDNRDGSLRRLIGAEENAELIGYAGRIVVDKGVIDLLRAFADVRKALPRSRLALIGDLESGEAAETVRMLREESAEMGLGGAVNLVDFTEDISTWMADMDVLALPSWHEGFGKVLIEAMASGVPPVATDVGGIPEIVRDEEDGLLVPPRDPAALSGAILRALKDPSLHKSMASKGRKRAEETFSVRRQVEATCELYTRIVGRRGASSGPRSPVRRGR